MGLSGLWAITEQMIHVSNPYIVGTTNLIYMHGSGCFAAVAAATAAQNFPKQDHGKILGLSKAYLGISSALVAIWKLDLTNSNTDGFLFALLCFVFISSVVFAFFLKPLPKHIAKTYIDTKEMGYNHCFKLQSNDLTRNMVETKNHSNLTVWFTLAIILAIYLIFVTLIQNYVAW